MTAALAKVRAEWMRRHPYSFSGLEDTPNKFPTWLQGARERLLTPPRTLEEDEALATLRLHMERSLNEYRYDGQRTTHRQRVLVARQLADVIDADERLVQAIGDRALMLRACHMCGAYGEDDETDKAVIAWDTKCGCALLCPHCARIEGRRMVNRYKDFARDWAKGRFRPVRVKEPIKSGARKGELRTVTRWLPVDKPGLAPLLARGRSIQYGVVTWPNVAPSQLSEYMREFPKLFKAVCDEFPAIKGSLLTLESPLSSRGDWNLHGNALLLKEGWLEWKDFRACWYDMTRHLFPQSTAPSFSIEFQKLPADEDALDAALRELIKYPVKHVTEKQNDATPRSRRPDGRTVESAGAKGSGTDAGVGGETGSRSDVDRKAVGGERRFGNWMLVFYFAPRGVPDRRVGAVALLSEHGWHAVSRRRTGGAAVAALNREREINRHDASASGGVEGRRAGEGRGDVQPDDRIVAVEAIALAPGMVDWAPELLLEWWAAHRRFRRTRSYGALFRLPDDEDDEEQRAGVTWRGRLEFDWRYGHYHVERVRLGEAVGLIQEDKSPGAGGSPVDKCSCPMCRGGPPPSGAPPGEQVPPGQ